MRHQAFTLGVVGSSPTWPTQENIEGEENMDKRDERLHSILDSTSGWDAMRVDNTKVREWTEKMVSGEWSLKETVAIPSNADTMKAIGEAENEMVLENFAKAIMDLAHEAELWEGSPETRLTHEQLFARVGTLMEKALQDRANIRIKYKVSLLAPWV